MRPTSPHIHPGPSSSVSICSKSRQSRAPSRKRCRAFRLVSVSVPAVNSVRCQLALEFHFSLNVLGRAEHTMLCRALLRVELLEEVKIGIERRALTIKVVWSVSDRQVQPRLDRARLRPMPFVQVRRQLGSHESRVLASHIENPALRPDRPGQSPRARSSGRKKSTASLRRATSRRSSARSTDRFAQ